MRAYWALPAERYRGENALADTTCQLEVEDWVRRNSLPPLYGQTFYPRELPLSPGGRFKFDAVSDDGLIVASISTSSATTASGKRSTGAVMKLRSDMLFLLMAEAQRPLIVLIEESMYALCQRQRERGRIPERIEFVHTPIPENLRAKLRAARRRSSEEIRAPQP